MPSKIVCSARASDDDATTAALDGPLALKKALFQSRQRAAKRRGGRESYEVVVDDKRGRNTQVAEDSSQTTAKAFYLRHSPHVQVQK